MPPTRSTRSGSPQRWASCAGFTVRKVSDRTFLIHLGGKIEVTPKVSLRTRDDLSRAYTPGVARVCLAIAENPADARRLTIKRNTVAVVTDGSAVLGLGNIGPAAALPVMEGKAALFKQFAGVDAWPVCLDTQDTDEIVSIVRAIAPVYGGINLEDIAAPRCFEIEERLRELLDIPVFHDDQHGTAIVVAAALRNALRVTGKYLAEVRIVVSGVGAAGTAIIKLLQAQGARTSSAATGTARCIRQRGAGRHAPLAAENTNPDDLTGSLAEVLAGADVFIGVSAPNLLQGSDIATMATGCHRVRAGQPGARGGPAGGQGTRRGGRHRAERLLQPDQQRAGVPRVLPRAAGHRRHRHHPGDADRRRRGHRRRGEPEELNPSYIVPSVFDPTVAPAVAAAIRRLTGDAESGPRPPR